MPARTPDRALPAALPACRGRRHLLLAGMAALGGWAGASRGAAGAGRGVSGKAGLLVTGQSNAGFFVEDGGIWTMNDGLAALLGLEKARFDPRLDGFRTIDGYALRDGAHRNPDMATTYGGTPLWGPGDEGAFLRHRPGVHPSQWGRGATGQGLDRFVRGLLAPADRAACLGILWIHTENDSRARRMGDVATHAAAIRRHLELIRAAFGRPAEGLPAYGWAPIPYGDSAEGHRAVRAALAEVVADPRQNFRLAIAQTADSEARGGQDWSHRDAPDLRAFGRRAAFAIARHLRGLHGLRTDGLPGPGPRIAGIRAEGATATSVLVAHDRGRRLLAAGAARDGRGWSVFDGGARRGVVAMEIVGADRILLRHEACTAGPEAREVGYCLLGEQVGRGNAVTDDWAAQAVPLPHGLDEDWRFDFPLQATLLPVPAAAPREGRTER
jgi:hypothetical protein